jgi:hypothetical protein
VFFIALDVSREAMDFVTNNLKEDKRIFEIYGMPYAGTSSATIYLVDQLSYVSGMNVIMMSRTSNINLELAKSYVNNQDKMIISIYDEDYKNSILNVLKQVRSHIGKINYVIIDDIWTLILHRKKEYIKNIFRDLNFIAKKLDIKGIFVVNQLRYDFYNKDSKESYKSLYKELLDPFLKGRLKVTRNDTDIFLDLDTSFKEFQVPKFSTDLLRQFFDF